VQGATAVFADAVESMAHQLGMALDDIRCEVQFAHATDDAEVPGRNVPKGSVAGIDVRWIGSADGHDLVEAQVRWTMSADLDLDWEVAMAYLIEVRGDPVNLRVDVLPADLANFRLEDISAMGASITAMPVVNAIAAVVAARAGIVTYRDLPTIASRLRPKH
jgi:hypothetical protein